jgi:hypothetical protein
LKIFHGFKKLRTFEKSSKFFKNREIYFENFVRKNEEKWFFPAELARQEKNEFSRREKEWPSAAVDRQKFAQLERGDFRRKSRARSQEISAGKRAAANFREIRMRNESEFRVSEKFLDKKFSSGVLLFSLSGLLVSDLDREISVENL